MKNHENFKDFFQTQPKLTNTFELDLFLQYFLSKTIPKDVYENIKPHLLHVGEQAAGQWLTWSAEANSNPPKHIPFDAWGNRIDDIVMHSGWKNLERAAAEEGIIATAYERKFGEWSHVYQVALMY